MNPLHQQSRVRRGPESGRLAVQRRSTARQASARCVLHHVAGGRAEARTEAANPSGEGRLLLLVQRHRLSRAATREGEASTSSIHPRTTWSSRRGRRRMASVRARDRGCGHRRRMRAARGEAHVGQCARDAVAERCSGGRSLRGCGDEARSRGSGVGAGRDPRLQR